MDPRWGYIGMVDRLSNGDITKHNDIYKLSYTQCLTQLLWWKDRDEYIEKLNKAEEGKLKSKTIRNGSRS